MYRYFFNTEMREKFYNCSGRTSDEWAYLGQSNVWLGSTFLIFGFIFFATYLPVMVCLVKLNLLQHSCYKIMFYLGVIDMLSIPVSAFVGYLSLIGMVFCMAPTFNYAFGSLALGLWITESSACMVLAFNRCLDFVSPKWANYLFEGQRVYFWLALVTMYGLSMWFFYPATVYSTVFFAFVTDPFAGMPERNGTVDLEHYPTQILSTYNLIAECWLFVMYLIICIHVMCQTRDRNIRTSRLQRQTFVTALLICLGTFMCTTTYMFIFHFTVPLWVVVFGDIGWQISHGMVGITYLLTNRTIRKAVFRMVLQRSMDINATSSVHITYSLKDDGTCSKQSVVPNMT